jgi:hypothetical protein
MEKGKNFKINWDDLFSFITAGVACSSPRPYGDDRCYMRVGKDGFVKSLLAQSKNDETPEGHFEVNYRELVSICQRVACENYTRKFNTIKVLINNDFLPNDTRKYKTVFSSKII